VAEAKVELPKASRGTLVFASSGKILDDGAGATRSCRSSDPQELSLILIEHTLLNHQLGSSEATPGSLFLLMISGLKLVLA
jgi:hypothetical protein